MPPIALTERLLMDAGGWQAMKLAKALLDSGRVVSAAYDPPILRGLVRDGDGEVRAGLKIVSASEIENLCSCRESRGWGTICAHSLAVGLARVRAATPAPPVQPAAAMSSTSTNRGPERSGALPSQTGEAAPKPAAAHGPCFVVSTANAIEAVELSVVLPPQLADAWARGTVTVGVEAVRAGRRTLINALDPKKTYRCSETDLRLVDALREINPGPLTGMLVLTREMAVVLFEAITGHPRVTLGKSLGLHVSEAPVRPVLEVKSDGQARLSLHVQLPQGVSLLSASAKAWQMKGTVLSQIAPGLPAAYLALLQRDIMISSEQAGRFLATELPVLRSFFQVSGAAAEGEAVRLVPEAGVFSLTLEGSLNHLTARLQRIYSKRVITIGITSVTENWAIPDPSDPARVLCRNVEAERLALSELTGFGFTGPDSTGHFVLKGERSILTFFATGYPRLQRQWDVVMGPRFTNIAADIERVAPRVEITSSGEEWFNLQFDLVTGAGERFSTVDVQRLLQSGQNHVRLKNGKVAVFDSAVLDDFQTVLRDCNPEQRQPGTYRISKAHAGYLDAAAADAGFGCNAPASWRNWAATQRGQQALEPVVLGDLESVLRNYQKHGTSWLTFLSSNGLGGLLADDMGLGKTLQALAFLRSQPGPALVVCPSSLVFNWQREVEKFTPERTVLVLEGPNRARLFSEIPKADLVITSYPLLRRDVARYRDFEFDTVILDEAQHIKNPDTQNSQAARVLRARRRFVLTGTPVENSVRDVWSLMDFVMPGYLGDRDDFRERYEIPISRHGSKEALERLSKRLRPFLLRRKKQEVATELPEKLEQVAYCELSTEQKEVYSALLGAARAKVDTARDSKNAGQARMLMLTALLRLRQAACDLRLLNRDDDAAARPARTSKNAEAAADDSQPAARYSGKLELFSELLQEAMDGGHRILVFSQFVSMLTLIRRELESSGVEYCYLDGQTKERAREVDRFQSGSIPVFLISLKAGGVGLNLTAADTVIHFDPWWNPAVEAQATDRAHRIGQRNVVTSYKLIARGTVEEKILNLQRKKREVIAAAIENEEPMMEALTMSEIESLLAE